MFYGGLIGGCIGLAITCFIMKQPFFEYTDVFFSIFPLGHSIGRIGCYLNGCCYGCKYSGLFSVNYIVNGEYIKVFPTWFVESIFCITLFIFFYFFYKTNIRGKRTAIYFITYSIYRFFIEFLRGDELRGIWYGFSTSQIISIFIFFFGVFLYIYSKQIGMKNFMIVAEDDNYGIR